MFEVDINGVVEALQNLTDSGAVDPVVKATVSLSESGFIAVNQAIAYGEIKDDSLTGQSLPPIFPVRFLTTRRQVQGPLWRIFHPGVG